MKQMLCWLFGHDRMTTSTRQRVCVRCGTRETLRDLGHVRAWEVLTKGAVPASKA
jgi:hypothetical protein